MSIKKKKKKKQSSMMSFMKSKKRSREGVDLADENHQNQKKRKLNPLDVDVTPIENANDIKTPEDPTSPPSQQDENEESKISSGDDILNDDLGFFQFSTPSKTAPTPDFMNDLDLDPHILELINTEKDYKEDQRKLLEEQKKYDKQLEEKAKLERVKESLLKTEEEIKERKRAREKKFEIDPYRLGPVLSDPDDDDDSHHDPDVTSSQKKINNFQKRVNRIDKTFSTLSLKTEMLHTRSIFNRPELPNREDLRNYSAISFVRMLNFARRKNSNFFDDPKRIKELFNIMAYHPNKNDAHWSYLILEQLCVSGNVKIGKKLFFDIFRNYGFHIFEKKKNSENSEVSSSKLTRVNYFKTSFLDAMEEVKIIHQNIEFVMRLLSITISKKPKSYKKKHSFRVVYFVCCSIVADKSFKSIVGTVAKTMYSLFDIKDINLNKIITYENYSATLPLRNVEKVPLSNIVPLIRCHGFNESSRKLKVRIFQDFLIKICGIQKNKNNYGSEDIFKDVMNKLVLDTKKAREMFLNPNETVTVSLDKSKKYQLGDREKSILILNDVYWTLSFILECFCQILNDLTYTKETYEYIASKYRELESVSKVFPRTDLSALRLKEILMFSSACWDHFNKQLDYLNEKFNGVISYKQTKMDSFLQDVSDDDEDDYEY